MATIGNTIVRDQWYSSDKEISFTVPQRFHLTTAHAYLRSDSGTSNQSSTFRVYRNGIQVVSTSVNNIDRTPSWKIITPTPSATLLFEKGDEIKFTLTNSDVEANAYVTVYGGGGFFSQQLKQYTIYATGVTYPTIDSIVPVDAVVENPIVWYEQPPQLLMVKSFGERTEYALNNGAYYKITVSKASMGGLIADTGWVAFSGSDITSTNKNFLLSYKAAKFPVLFTELVSDPDQIYTWTAQIRVGDGIATTGPYDTTLELDGSFLYTLENHSPGADNLYPSGTLNTVNPTIQATFDDESEAATDLELRHTMVDYRIQIFLGSDTLIADTGTIEATSIPNTPYVLANFPILFTELEYSTSYTMRVTTTCSEGYTGFNDVAFTTTSHFPVVTITAPVSGDSDRTPQLVGLFSDPSGHSHINTVWFIYHGDELIAETLPGFNSLTPTYDHTNTTVWLYGEELLYGETYIIQMRAQCEEFSWSDLSTRTFSIVAYAPVATITTAMPATKIDTLTPTFEATYTSSLGNPKEAHRFEVWNSTETTMLATTGDIVSGTSPFEALYSNVLFTTHAELSWDTTYILKVFVKDNEDIWNAPVAGSPSYRVFKTNSPPLAPTNLSPNAEEVTTMIPSLTATFNDPDAGDTISVMEVEVRRADDNTLVLLRAEAQTTNQFTTFVSDGFAVDSTYRWRVRFTDQGTLQGIWSPWATFTVVEGATVAFTYPAFSETLTTPVQTFTWTYSHPSGVLQSSGRLRIYTADGTLPIYDSGIVPGSYLSQVIPPTLLTNGTEYRARVDVTDAGGEQANTGNWFFDTAWIGPPQPENIYAFPDTETSSVQIVWDISDVDEFREYRIYERDSEGVGSWTYIDEVLVQEQGSYNYYYAPSGRSIDYTVTVASIIDDALLESSIESFASAVLQFPHVTWFMDSEEPETYQFSLERNPTRDENYTRQAIYTETLGRRSPVVHFGNNFMHTVSMQFNLKMPYNTTISMIKLLIARGKPVLYKDSRGRRMWVDIHNYSLQDILPNKASISLDIRTIDYKEL